MRMLPLGDSTLLVQLGTTIDEETHERVLAAFDALSAAAIPGVHDIVPAYTAVAVHYDPLRIVSEELVADRTEPAWNRLRRTVAHVLDRHDLTNDGATRRIVEIPVRYGGEYGPDIDHVARHARIAPEEVAALHSSVDYRVHMVGFTPGFPYLGGLPARLATPRRASPRMRVPAGSVGIAGTQTGVYPLDSPGGWQIIGRTDLRLFRPENEPPTFVRPGDRVRFVPIEEA